MVVKEYENGVLVNDSENEDYSESIASRELINSLPYENREAVANSGEAYDLDKGIYRLAEKVSIGFSPNTDSKKNVKLIVGNLGVLGKTIKMKSMTAPGYEGEYLYDFLTFTTDKITINGFTPLVLMGSYWYDKPFKAVRFYGDDNLDASSPSLRQIPHYYVLGIKVEQVYQTLKAYSTPVGKGASIPVPTSGRN